MSDPTTVYTDGAALGNPGPAGWAWIVVDGGPYASGAEAHSTNQRMEIKAVLEGLQALGPEAGRIHVRSDSTYVVNCFRDRWWEGWLARGWLNKAKKPVANRDLWEPLIDLVRSRGDVTFEWVKGHGEDPWNDLADRLCTDAARLQEGRSGVGIPDDLGPPDTPGVRRAAAPAASAPRRELADGHLVVVTGHRPPELGGYERNPVAEGVRDKLTEILRAKRSMHDDLVVVTGMGLGAEQLAAEAAAAAGVPYVAVLPYPEPDAVWPSESRRRYEQLLAGAGSTVTMQDQRPKSKQQAGTALARRDAFLARHADEAIVVWDGDDDLVGRHVRSLRDHLGEEEVWVVEP